LVVDVRTSLFSPPTEENGYYPIREAKREYSHYRLYPGKLIMRHEYRGPAEWAGKAGVLDDRQMISCKRMTSVRRYAWL
jgi:hypothetical protein